LKPAAEKREHDRAAFGDLFYDVVGHGQMRAVEDVSEQRNPPFASLLGPDLDLKIALLSKV